MTAGTAETNERRRARLDVVKAPDPATLRRLDAAIRAHVTVEDLEERFVRVGVTTQYIATRKRELIEQGEMTVTKKKAAKPEERPSTITTADGSAAVVETTAQNARSAVGETIMGRLERASAPLNDKQISASTGIALVEVRSAITAGVAGKVLVGSVDGKGRWHGVALATPTDVIMMVVPSLDELEAKLAATEAPTPKPTLVPEPNPPAPTPGKVDPRAGMFALLNAYERGGGKDGGAKTTAELTDALRKMGEANAAATLKSMEKAAAKDHPGDFLLVARAAYVATGFAGNVAPKKGAAKAPSDKPQTYSVCARNKGSDVPCVQHTLPEWFGAKVGDRVRPVQIDVDALPAEVVEALGLGSGGRYVVALVLEPKQAVDKAAAE